MVGDSNLRLCREVPFGWQIECIPGIHLSQLKNILHHTDRTSKCLKNIVIQAGINDRFSSRPDVESCIDAAKQPGVTIHYQGISMSRECATKLGSITSSNIYTINKSAKKHIGKFYINPLPPMYVTTTEPGGIHYSLNTCRDIIEGMVTAIDTLN